MMLAASFSLMREAIAFDEVEGLLGYHSVFRALLGIGLGIVFILGALELPFPSLPFLLLSQAIRRSRPSSQ